MAQIAESRIAFDDEQWGALGRLRRGGAWAMTRGVRGRRFPHFALIYVVAGEGRFTDELGTDERMSAGDALLVVPFVEHTYGPSAGQIWSEQYIVFDGPVFDLWRSRGVLDPRRPIRRLEPIDHWFAELDGFMRQPLPKTEHERELRLCRFLVLLATVLRASPGRNSESDWIDHARALLATDLGSPLELERVSADLGVSYETFRKRFRREAGVSPTAYRAARRMDAAHELLTTTAMSHREIAIALGFGDEFHFSKRFKQATGSNPRDVRRHATGAG